MPRDPGADSAAYTRYGARFEAACLGHCLMAGAGLKSIAAAAAAFVLLGIATPAGSRAADRFNSIADVIPAPAQAQPGRGIFALRTGTKVSIPRDPQAARIGRYFAALLLQTRGTALEVVERTGANPPAGAVGFALVSHRAKPDAGDVRSGPEGYRLDALPQRVVVSAGDRRGLCYGAVTLWPLCTAGAPVHGRITLPAPPIVAAPRFPWPGL